mgnify:CR=1 FL=1
MICKKSRRDTFVVNEGVGIMIKFNGEKFEFCRIWLNFDVLRLLTNVK